MKKIEILYHTEQMNQINIDLYYSSYRITTMAIYIDPFSLELENVSQKSWGKFAKK